MRRPPSTGIAWLVLALMTCPGWALDAKPQGYSAAALYNLGNAYARAGKPGMAVLNYERASLLAPNDPDVEANLSYVRASARVPAGSRSRLEHALTAVSPTVAAWLGLAGLVLLGMSLLAGRAHSKLRWMRCTAAAAGTLLIALTMGNGIVLWPRIHEAVILANAPVRVSPVPMGDELFTLPEAETVRMTAEHEGFVLVRTRAGRTGWVASANLAPVVP